MNRKSIALALVVACAVLQGCGGADVRRARALELGHQYLAEQNYTKARIEFSNALQIEPNDADARYYVAFVAEKLGDLRVAAQGYQGALNVEATHPLALAALARLYVFSGLPEQGLELVDKGLAAHPDHVELVVVRAAANLALGREADAVEEATKVLAAQPNHEYATALLAGIYRNRGDNERAKELVESALAGSPDSVDIRIVLAQLLLDTQDNARAEAELKRIVELRPTELVHRQRLVAFYAATGRADAAEATLRELVELEPANVDHKLALVSYIASQQTFDVAERELQAFMEQSPEDDALWLAAGQFYETRNFPDDALRLYSTVIERAGLDAAGLTARNRVAALRVRANRIAEAEPLIAEVLEENPRDNDALVLRASIALAANRVNDAITDLRAVLRDQPESSALLRTLARAHAQNSEPDLARDNYRRALEVDPANSQVRIEYAEYLNRRGDNEEARPLLDAVVKAEPQNVAALELQVRVLGTLGDSEGAAAAARAIVVAQPDSPLGYYLEGLVQEAQRDAASALASYERALEKQPRGAEPLAAVARVLVTTDRRAEARTFLERIVEQQPDSALALNLLAEIMLGERDFTAAAALADRAIAVDARWWLPHRTKALALLASGAKEQAKEAYRSGLEASGDAPALGMDLAALYERDNEPDRAIEIYERLHRNDPKSEALANNLAMLLSTYRDDGVSYERAGELVRAFRNSSNPAYLNTYGWVRYRQRQYGEAVSYLRRAAQAEPGNPLMRYHLGMALIANGERDQARGELERALESEQPFPARDAAQQALDSLRNPG
jgi:tetratricopeptide (TPR) repeat protein